MSRPFRIAVGAHAYGDHSNRSVSKRSRFFDDRAPEINLGFQPLGMVSRRCLVGRDRRRTKTVETLDHFRIFECGI